jgi:hypothetical protein
MAKTVVTFKLEEEIFSRLKKIAEKEAEEYQKFERGFGNTISSFTMLPRPILKGNAGAISRLNMLFAGPSSGLSPSQYCSGSQPMGFTLAS